MDEDDLVSYRQYNTGAHRTAKKRPAPSPSPTVQRTTMPHPFNESDMDEDLLAIPELNDQRQTNGTDVGNTTYTVLSQQSIVGLQQSEDVLADMTEDEDEEN